jgi:hypothetical protein
MPVYTVFVIRHNCATSKITPEAKLYIVEDAARGPLTRTLPQTQLLFNAGTLAKTNESSTTFPEQLDVPGG